MALVTGGSDPKEFELVLTKSPMTGSTTEQKSEKQTEPVTTGFEHIANIPTIFCAPRDLARGLLVDLFAMIGTLNAIETGNVNAETLPVVLQNAQKILTNLSDVMIRDCGVTEQDLEEVMNVFKEVNAEASQQVTAQRAKQSEQKPVVAPAVEPPKKESKTGTNIL
jgi:hypothetical protein